MTTDPTPVPPPRPRAMPDASGDSSAPGATSRRAFLRAAGLAGAGMALGVDLEASPASFVERVDRPGSGARRSGFPKSTGSPKSILILGGTGFIGPHMVSHAVARGHQVTVFTRGRTQADLPDVEHLVGDRNDDLSALEGRRWEVVLDNNARDYRWVRLSTGVLRDAAEHYLFVSTVSVYVEGSSGYESSARILVDPMIHPASPRHRPPSGFQDGQEAAYGLTKALGEDLVHAAFPGRATIVRPGLIVGPGDPTDRFTYWPVRIDKGGDVLAPGNPEHANQIIDQRDLGEWIVRLAESGTIGDFNAAGPAARMSMAEMLHGIRAATSAPVRFTWVSEAFLEAHGVRPWSDLPAWIPGDPQTLVDIAGSLAAGLTFRPLADTVRDLLEWDRGRPAGARTGPPPGLSPEREQGLLAEWRRR
jgi:2'-hydroxyisoflavone reductase